MALYMLMAKYTDDALRSIMASGSNREAAARTAVETAGGKLLGFYGMFGQDYQMVLIVDAPGHAEYIGALGPVLASGTLASYKTIPLYAWSDVEKALPIARKVGAAYRPPGS